jgi:DNA-binding transcriptional MerR regulator
MTIGKLAKLAGVTPDTIRYYERRGLLPKPVRTPAGYRQYTPAALRRLTTVRNAQRFGFSLGEIAAFLRVRDRGGKPCQDVRTAAGKMLEALEVEIAQLVARRERMRETLGLWDAQLARTPSDQPARLLDGLDAPATRMR